MSPIIIHDGYSYLITVIISLYYHNPWCSDYEYTNDVSFVYLNDIVQCIVNKLHNNYSIDLSTISEVQNYMIVCGYDKVQNMLECVDFMIKHLNFNSIFSVIRIDPDSYQTSIRKCIEKEVEVYDNNVIVIIPNRHKDYELDIEKRIKKGTYLVHSITCWDPLTNTYFSIVKHNNRWLMFNSHNIPANQFINIKDWEYHIKHYSMMITYMRVKT